MEPRHADLFGLRKTDPIYLRLRRVTALYAVAAAVLGLIYLFMQAIWPGKIPITFQRLTGGTELLRWTYLWHGMVAAVPLFVWALITGGLKVIWSRRRVTGYSLPVQLARSAYLVLVHAAFEELTFRVLLLLVLAYPLEWLNTLLHPHFEHVLMGTVTITPDNVWPVVLLALLLAGKFRNWYYSVEGTVDTLTLPMWRVNSWLLGMAMFYIMAHYGLLTAIVAHALYDLIVLSPLMWRAKRLELAGDSMWDKTLDLRGAKTVYLPEHDVV